MERLPFKEIALQETKKITKAGPPSPFSLGVEFCEGDLPPRMQLGVRCPRRAPGARARFSIVCISDAPSGRSVCLNTRPTLTYLFSGYKNNHQLCCCPGTPQKGRSKNFVFERHSQRPCIPSLVPQVLPSLDTSFRAASDRGIRGILASIHSSLPRACVVATVELCPQQCTLSRSSRCCRGVTCAKPAKGTFVLFISTSQ